jgi:hypothetical protein
LTPRRLANSETATFVTASMHGIYFTVNVTTTKAIPIRSFHY